MTLEITTGEDNGPEPWERQPGETAKQYDAFCHYRKMRPLERSIRGLARQLGRRDHVQLSKWSASNDWVARHDAYWQHLDEIERAAQDNRVAELGRLRADVAVESLSVVVKRLRGDEGDPENGVPATPALEVSKLDAKDLAALANVGEKIGASLDRVALEKAGDGNRDVNLKVSFDLTPHYGPQDAIDVPVHEELPEGGE